MDSATEIYSMPGGMTGVKSAHRWRWGDFYELSKPRMNALVVGTTMVGYTMAVQSSADWVRAPNTLIGTALCAAGAAILNQWAERRYDALMPRTANRPLPTGRILPGEALALGLLAAVCGGLYLLYFVNALTAFLGMATLTSYVLVYTPLKRLTTLNTIVGAIPGAIPPVMGWTAVTGSISSPALAMFAILFVWQVPHFLAIAIMYRDDYEAGGFKMLPVADRELKATGRQILLYATALVPVSLTPAISGAAGPVYAVAAIVLGIVFLGYAVMCAARRTRGHARKLFFASIIYLPVLLTVMMLDRI
jgi:protoheme IX farnesyltransferase